MSAAGRFSRWRCPDEGVTRGGVHARADDHVSADRADPRLVDDAAQLGRLGGVLPGEGTPGHRAGVPRLRGRGRGAPREARDHRRGERPRDAGAPRAHRREPGRTAHPHGPLVRRDLHTAAREPRARRRRRDDRLGPTRGRASQPALTDQVPVPLPGEPRQPAPRGGLHQGAVPLRLRQHGQSGRVRRRLRPPPHPRAGQLGLGPTASSRTGSPGTRTPGSTTTWTTALRCCSSSAARTT